MLAVGPLSSVLRADGCTIALLEPDMEHVFLCLCLDSIQYVDSSFNLYNSSVFTILSKCLAISLRLAIVFALYALLLPFRAESEHFYYLMMWQSCLEKCSSQVPEPMVTTSNYNNGKQKSSKCWVPRAGTTKYLASPSDK